MDDPEDEDDSIGIEHVVRDPVVADAQPVERVSLAVDRLDELALDPARARRVARRLLERANKSSAKLRRELLERLRCGRAELDAKRVQVSSVRLTVRPSA